MRRLVLLFLLIITSSFVGAQVVSSDQNFFGSRSGTASFVNYGSSFSTYYGPDANTYWPVLSNRDECTASQDILVQISPVGCQPAVVRSDLLAEQNVPVFCQLDLLQINPAINIKQIRNIRFNGRYPEYVAGVGFHPANAALRTTNQLLGTPLESNIGYVVVVLKRNPDESKMPNFFNFTLSASIDYYSGNAIGIGATELLLRETNDKEWEIAKNRQTLFNGKMSVRVKDTDNNDSIRVELYSGDIKYSETILQKNRPQSNAIYLPGSYCQTALQLSYNDFVSPSAIARVKVDDDVLDLYSGSRFLNNKCLVRDVSDGKIEINCGSGNMQLSSIIELLKIGDRVYTLNKDLTVNMTKEYVISKIIKNNTGSYYDLGEKNVSISSVRPVVAPELFDKTYGEYDKYVADSIKYYETLAADFGNEKKDLGDSYGEIALTNAIELAYNNDKKSTALRLINKYLDSYPAGKNKDQYVKYLNELYLKDSSSTGVSVQTEDGFHLIRLIDVSAAGKKSNARISWGAGPEQVLEQGQSRDFINIGTLRLVRVRDSENIDIDATCFSNARENKPFNSTIRLNSNTLIRACGENIRVLKVEFEDYVKLRIAPVTRSGTIANFTVGVGIEKRAIELTPSKAKKKIENLNKSIQKWESISTNLGKVVTNLKTACFATAGVLTVKNFFTGLSGEALARRTVMSGENGWTTFCQSAVNSGNYSSMTQCYNNKAPDIANDVNARKIAIDNTNNFTRFIEERSKYSNREGIFTGESFNDTNAKQLLIEKIRNDCKTQGLGTKSAAVNSRYTRVDSLFDQNVDVNTYSYSQLRDIYYNCQAIKNGGSYVGKAQAETELDALGASVAERLKYEQTSKSYGDVNVYALNSKNRGQYYRDTVGTIKSKGYNLGSLSDNTPAQVVATTANNYYLVTFDERSGQGFSTKEIYRLNGKVMDSAPIPPTNLPSDLSKNLPTFFDLTTAASYNNQFAPGENKVSYFETEPYKGYPSIVPFDFNKGFYAATTQALPILGGTKSFEGNGNPSSFFVCNIMKNKRVDFYAPNYGDDECIQFNIYTGQSFSNFPGLSEDESRRIVSEAIKALKDAASQYGKSTVKIGSNTLTVGRAASLLPGSQCQDFMSPEDCKILFNVCDPVICPSSRCNFGGTYYVSDVIQSGIVGSALLCLPNIKEDIVMPVCLTGIKAGIDGYLSILKSHQQCLQESIDTGRYVGICDQISSVYMCEFFWRQAAPLAKSVIPKIVEYAYSGGQGNVRGGGEYLTVQNSWQNAQDSVNYFTQSYAVNSIEAFKIRSVEDAGTEICRAFISAKGPKTFETLVQPDSPPQFHAWFSSIDFTDATVPATSQYKVFYHIFAGNDRGVSYSVYLKDPPASSAYANNPIVVVATGFVGKGQYATESKDSTAPKGYQQLCVRINDKEECGFKQVSSSFAVNYVRDSIVADQLKATVTTESECISGSLNPTALLNPNIQSAAEEALNPAIYNRGIVRVCSTDNPGKGTDPGRFVNVGFCGESRRGCWLDKNSLDKSITDVNAGLGNKSLTEIEQIQKKYLTDKNQFVGTPDLKVELDSIKSDIENVNDAKLSGIISKLDYLFNRTTWNSDRAEILFWKAKAYEGVFLKSIQILALNVKGAVPVTNNPVTNAKLVILEKAYSPNEIIYLKLNGQATKVWFRDDEINFWINDTSYIKIGDIMPDKDIELYDSNGISLNNIEKFENIFGAGSYLVFDDKLNLNCLQSGIDLSKEPIICGLNNARLVKFEVNYQEGQRTYLTFNGVKTNLFFLNKRIYFENNGKSDYVGDVKNDGSIALNALYSDEKFVDVEINNIFGLDSFRLFNDKVKLDNLKNGIDLNGLMVNTAVGQGRS